MISIVGKLRGAANFTDLFTVCLTTVPRAGLICQVLGDSVFHPNLSSSRGKKLSLLPHFVHNVLSTSWPLNS